MSPNTSRRVLLGEITGVHGIRGEVIVRTYTEPPENIGAYGPLEDEAGTTNFNIEVKRVSSKGAVVLITGLADRTAAEKLRGTRLYIARDKLPAAEAGAYYHADLVGLAAVDPEGATFGTIVAVHNFGAGDILEVQLTENKQTELIPFTNDAVPEVDIAAGRVVVVMPLTTVVEGEADGEPV